MAEVTGELGGQPIQLNNAATEATLQQLVGAITAMAKASGKDAKSQKELEKELKKLADSSKKLKKEQDELTESAKKEREEKDKAAKAAAKEKKAIEDLAVGMGSLLGAVEKTALGMTNLMSSLANVGNSMSSAAQAMNAIPIVGGTLAGVFGAVAGAAEKSYKAFQQSASVGANFGGSITEMINAASGAGMTFDQFSSLLAKNGANIALLGGSSSAGAKRLAELGKSIRQSPIGDELARLGYSTEDINNGMAGFAGRLAKTGALQNMTNDQLVASTGKYLQNLDAVSKLTGKSKDALQAEQDARMADAQFMAMASKLDADSQANLHSLMDSIPKEHQAGLKEIMSTGTATSEAGRQAMAFLNKSGMDAARLGQQMQASGKLTQDQAVSFQRSYQNEAKQLAKSPLGETLAKFHDGANGFMAATYETAGRTKDLGQIFSESAKEAEERKKKAEGQLDPAVMKRFQEGIAKTGNDFTKALANSGMLDTLMNAFQALADFTMAYVVPGFQFIADHSTAFGIVLGVLAGTIGAVKAYLATQALLTNIYNGVLGATTLISTKFGVSMAVAGVAFGGIILAVGLVVAGFKMLYDKGFTFGSALEALGDNLERFFLLLKEGFLSVLDKITFGDVNKKIKADIAGLEIQRQELDEKEKARDQRRAEKRQERGIKDEETKATKESTEATKDQTKAVKEAAAAAAAGIDYTDPMSILKGKMGGTAQPGASSGLGGMSAAFESGKAGTSAVGWDSTGGTSYGKYQIATKTGTMDKFMQHLKQSNPEAFERLTAAGPADSGKDGAFAKEWKKLSGEGKLASAEHDFIKKTHYDVGVGKVKDKNLQDMIGKSKALQEVMFSTSVQHGGGGAGSIFNKSYKEGMSEQDLIKAIYAERGTKFGSSTAAVQSSVQSRFAQEQQLALGLVGTPSQQSAPSSSQVATAVTPDQKPVKDAAVAAAAAQSTVAGTGKTQETPESLLASLNTKMDHLIKYTALVASINERQLTVQKGLSNDLYAA